MTTETETDTVDLLFTREQLSLIERAAAARGCSVAEFILAESLAEAKRMTDPAVAPVSCPG